MVSAPFRPGAGPPADPNRKLYPQRAAADFHIGIMGLGEIGGYIADQLARLGYRVSGWSRSEKQLAGVTCYRGEEALDHFLGSLDGLINLLPLTAQTRGILAAPLFNRLPAGAVLINCGRGEHMVNEDVLAALEAASSPGRCSTSSRRSHCRRTIRCGAIRRWSSPRIWPLRPLPR